PLVSSFLFLTSGFPASADLNRGLHSETIAAWQTITQPMYQPTSRKWHGRPCPAASATWPCVGASNSAPARRERKLSRSLASRRSALKSSEKCVTRNEGGGRRHGWLHVGSRGAVQ